MSLRHIEVLRTSDSQFRGLPDYDFTPHYFSSPRFSTNLGEPLRYHYLDEGAADAAETILLLHGEQLVLLVSPHDSTPCCSWLPLHCT